MTPHRPDDVVITEMRQAEAADLYRVAGIDFHSREQAETAALAAARAGGVSVWIERAGSTRELLATFREGMTAEPPPRTRRDTLEDLLGLVMELSARDTLDEECPPLARAALLETEASLRERLAPEYGDSPIPPDEANRQRQEMASAAVLCTNKAREAFADILRMYDEYLSAGGES